MLSSNPPTPPGWTQQRKPTGEDLGVERGLPRAFFCQVVPLQHPAERREQRGHRQGRPGGSFLGSPRVSETTAIQQYYRFVENMNLVHW